MSKSKVERDMVRSVVERRYSACSDAVALIDIMLANGELFKKALRKAYNDEEASREPAGAWTTISYDLRSLKDDLANMAMSLAEERKRLDSHSSKEL